MALSIYESDRSGRFASYGSRIGNGGLITPPLERVRSHLRDAFDDQAEQIAGGRYANFRGVKGRAFVEEFLSDPLFPPFFKAARKVATSEPDNDQFEKRVRGAAFELMADLYLASHDRSPRVPVTGTIAAEVQHILKPDNRVDDFGLGQIGIDRQILYDGFMMRSGQEGEPQAEGAIEATLMMDWRKGKERQVGGVRSFFADLGELGPQDPYLMIITPKFLDSEGQKITEPRWQLIGDQVIERAYVPVTSAFLMIEFLPYLFKEHPGRRGRTLAQERNRWLASSAGKKLKMGEPALYRRG